MFRYKSTAERQFSFITQPVFPQPFERLLTAFYRFPQLYSHQNAEKNILTCEILYWKGFQGFPACGKIKQAKNPAGEWEKVLFCVNCNATIPIH